MCCEEHHVCLHCDQLICSHIQHCAAARNYGTEVGTGGDDWCPETEWIVEEFLHDDDGFCPRCPSTAGFPVDHLSGEVVHPPMVRAPSSSSSSSPASASPTSASSSSAPSPQGVTAGGGAGANAGSSGRESGGGGGGGWRHRVKRIVNGSAFTASGKQQQQQQQEVGDVQQTESRQKQSADDNAKGEGVEPGRQRQGN